MKLKLKNKTLNEDTLKDVIDDFGKEGAEETKKALDKVKGLHFDIESEPWADENSADIEKALDGALRKSRQFQNWLSIYEQSGEEPPKNYSKKMGTNVLLVGPAGTGKTSRVYSWAADRGINVVVKNAQTMDASDLGGIISRMYGEDGKPLNKSTKLTNDEFNILDTPDTVLFLDELNRANSEIRGALLTLIQDHAIVDHDSPTGKSILKGMLFTVAAINPASEGYETDELDMAMKTRFRRKYVEFNNKEHLEYLRKTYGEIINDERLPDEDRIEYYGKYQIAKKLLTDPDFHFDTKEEEEELSGTDYQALNYRSFDELLDACDGTKEDFLDMWSEFCNPMKQELVQGILADYIDFDAEGFYDDDAEDIDDEANSVFNTGSTGSAWDKISGLI